MNNKVPTLMSFRESTESRLTTAERINTKFQLFLEKDWQPQFLSFQDFLNEEWPPVKQRFDQILQSDIDGNPENRPTRHEIELSPEQPMTEGQGADTTMTPTRCSGKRSTTERSDPPTTQAVKRHTDTNGSASGRWWAHHLPLEPDQSSKSWHTDLLGALLSQWNDMNMTKLQHWISAHATKEMQATLKTLSTSNTTRRALHAGLQTLLRGACVPPLIVSAHAPPRATLSKTGATSSTNDHRRSRH